MAYRAHMDKLTWHSEFTDRLYSDEERARDAIKMAAEDLLLVLGLKREEYFRVAISTELFTMLDAFDPKSALAACEAYLKMHSFAITGSLQAEKKKKPESAVDE